MKLEKRGCWSCLSMTCEFIAFVYAQKKKKGGGGNCSDNTDFSKKW